MRLSRTVYCYRGKKPDQTPLRVRIKEIAYAQVRYGFERIQVLLRREEWQVNRKCTYRLYCLEGLNLRYKKPRRHKSSSQRVTRLPATEVNECWSIDFVCDQLFTGTRFRFLTVVDIFSRECLAITVGQRLTNAYIESFNGSFRDECLNIHWFLSLEDAKLKAENWRQDYNVLRPHRGLNNLTPIEFAKKSARE